MSTPNDTTKRCNKCKELKSTDEFYRRKDGGTGFRSMCKSCYIKRTSQYHRDNPDISAAACRKWRSINQTYAHLWDLANPDKRKSSYRKWRSKNHSKTRIYASRRRARILGLPNDLTPSDWDRCLKHFDYKCAVCGKPRGLWHILAQDHWIPLNNPNCLGTTPLNIVPLCHAIQDGESGCNNSKRDQDPYEWLVWKFGARRAKQISDKIEQYFASIKDG